ncbi:UDP-N-acetylglucosamine pyrophosphorylase /glucosamine-1-phosphate N-acetyltransferase [Roseibium hamelinense]|uniref:Bifunctional protein GlmU n=1 Tax=Roseibium hamelinense TaxID=150831 RepID=A0A562THP0_9HYPH|nr:bifunctional UDP-N-acetylglucosamine diphosphorylase/glucosamine-1-phosphate N-acetyltransferase GlmU [Roseibium hamelinense]MTI45735.1 bifunctional UDP-N-acetylglucosamine diphosphorylase/glucosamine-1-phosphate N-acetyltransferase GlmU [Roseibium hamelinense]TWI93082.1 UDP-N-acetylglucosamine pyrophosphorylase /glucosamine-1-phosphate N-acetyltransferase [Roseibium hamelinense]
MSDKDVLAIVLAAGLGTRMRSKLPKVMHAIGHLPMVGHVLKALGEAEVPKVSVVTGPDMEGLTEFVSSRWPHARCHIQTDRLGTAHAALAAHEALSTHDGGVLILFGDTPLITADTVQSVRTKLGQGADVVVLGFEAANPHGYGRILSDANGVYAIREEKDATDEERMVTFCNSGIMGLSGAHAMQILEAIGNDNAKGEYYLTDAVEIARSKGLTITTAVAVEDEVQGINTRAQLAACETVFQQRKRRAVLETGVTMLAPETIYFAHDTVIEPDVVLEQNLVFGPGVRVKAGSVIRAFSHLEGATVGEGSTVGPYARLRPGASLSEGAHIGNFVEIKNATIGVGAKINHLSYIGDASVGSRTNVGAGTITCNYDGFGKHRTEIGAGSFVGSNSTLVAPLKLGSGVYVAAGSTVTEAVPTDALVIGRGRQVVKDQRAKDLRARFKAAKDQRR